MLIEEDDPRFELALARAFDSLALPVTPQAVYASGGRRRAGMAWPAALAGAPAVLGTKAVAAAAAVTLAGAAVGVKTVVTGSPDPTHWGQQVTQQVQSCKDQLTSGQHGIGPCVSGFANQHGKQEAAAHTPANKSNNGNHAHGPPTDPGNSGQHGPPASLPHATHGAAPPNPHPKH